MDAEDPHVAEVRELGVEARIESGRSAASRAVDVVVDHDVSDALGREDPGGHGIAEVASDEADRLVA